MDQHISHIRNSKTKGMMRIWGKEQCGQESFTVFSIPSLDFILLQEIPLYTVLWPLLTVPCFTQGALVNPPHAALFSATELVFLNSHRNAGLQ